MGKRGPPKKGSKSRKKQKNDSTTTTTKETPVKKSILWASSDGVNGQKLYIDLIARRCTSDCTNTYTQVLIGS
jgi:hypothetical protein